MHKKRLLRQPFFIGRPNPAGHSLTALRDWGGGIVGLGAPCYLDRLYAHFNVDNIREAMPLRSILALALAMGTIIPAAAADYRFAADVYTDANTVRRFEASLAPQQNKTMEAAPGYELRFAVGEEGPAGATTRTSIWQIRQGQPVEVAGVTQGGPASDLRATTLSACSTALALGAHVSRAVNGTLAVPGLRFQLCPEGPAQAVHRPSDPANGGAQ